MSRTVRLVVTAGIAWILSLAVAIVVLSGIHRVLSMSRGRGPQTAADRAPPPRIAGRVAGVGRRPPAGHRADR
ncbi:MAG TPA: hypothetical protein VKZ18_10825 [Polyangia bacterium]|nr:hypothetical protein [Polyangia bacterium]